jgi:WD40 repeat protein
LVIAVAVTPDGRRAVSGSRDETLRVWDLEMGREERMLEGHTDDVNAVAVTPDGRRVMSGSEDHTLRVWDLETGRELACFSAEAAMLAFALTPDGRVVAGDRAGNVYCLQYVE